MMEAKNVSNILAGDLNRKLCLNKKGIVKCLKQRYFNGVKWTEFTGNGIGWRYFEHCDESSVYLTFKNHASYI
jgi:hypothetical protein